MTTHTDVELIRLAAEKVLGLTEAEVLPGEGQFVVCGTTAHPRLYIEGDQPWNPLLSISDAWMLVEKLRVKNGYLLSLEFQNYKDQKCFAGFGYLNTNCAKGQAVEKDAPRAITLAALRAKGAI